MVRIKALVAAVASLTLALATCLAQAGPGSIAHAGELTRAISDYDQATVAKNTKALAALVTDDYVLVNSNGSVQDKASYLADFSMPDFTIAPYRMEEPFLRMHADAALTGGTFRLRWAQDGRQHSRRLRVAHFWVRQVGRWRLAHTQLTRIPG